MLRWRVSEKCIKYKLANNIPFKEYEEPAGFLPQKEERERIENYEVIFEDKKFEKYEYALYYLQIEASKNSLDSIDYSKDFKRIYQKLDKLKNVSTSDAHNFNMLMSQASLIRIDLMSEQGKKIRDIKKQITQMYANNQTD